MNLVIGHVFFAALEAREGLKIGQREDKMGATINTITSNKSLLAHVFRRVGHLLP